MNLVDMRGGEAVTTSMAIAEGVGYEHENVIKLVRRNLADFEEFARVGFEIRPFETAGGTQKRQIAILNEPQATLLLTYMRNSETVREFKKTLVRAFFDLRDNRDLSKLSRLEVLQIAMDAEEERLKLQEQIEEDAPRVEFARKVEAAPDAITVAKAAKVIGTGQRRLFSFLRQAGWITRHNEPYQARIESGHLDVKLTNWDHPSLGLRQSVTTLVTGKGLAELQRLFDERESGAA